MHCYKCLKEKVYIMTLRDREYEALRREIEKISEFENSLYNILYVSVTAILAWGVSSENALICLLAYCIIFPSFRIMLSYNAAVLRIGAYILVFYPEYFWEKRLNDFYSLPKGKFIRYSSSYKIPFMFTSILSTILSLIILYENPMSKYFNIIIICLSLLLFLIFIGYAFMRSGSNTIKKQYIEEFKKMEEKEKCKPEPDNTSQNEPTPTDQ